MNAKLTLSLDKEVIEEMKNYAKIHNVSLSKVVENYFRLVSGKRKQEHEPTAIVEELSGVITLPQHFDEKEEYAQYLTEKYK